MGCENLATKTDIKQVLDRLDLFSNEIKSAQESINNNVNYTRDFVSGAVYDTSNSILDEIRKSKKEINENIDSSKNTIITILNDGIMVLLNAIAEIDLDVDFSPVLEAINNLDLDVDIDFSPVLSAINNLDLDVDFSPVLEAINNLDLDVDIDFSPVLSAINNLDLDVNLSPILLAIDNLDLDVDLSPILLAINNLDLDVDFFPVLEAINNLDLDVDLSPILLAINNLDLDVNLSPILSAINNLDLDVDLSPILLAINNLDLDVDLSPILLAINNLDLDVDLSPILLAINNLDLDVDLSPILLAINNLDLDVDLSSFTTAIATLTATFEANLVTINTSIEEVEEKLYIEATLEDFDCEDNQSTSNNSITVRNLNEAITVLNDRIIEVQQQVCELDTCPITIAGEPMDEISTKGLILVLDFIKIEDFPHRPRAASKWRVQIPHAKEEYDWCTDFDSIRWHRGKSFHRLKLSNYRKPFSGWFKDRQSSDAFFDAILPLTKSVEQDRYYPERKNYKIQPEEVVTRIHRAYLIDVDPENRIMNTIQCYKPKACL